MTEAGHRLRMLPSALAERARRFAAGDQTPVAPKPAATVVLLRDESGDAAEANALDRGAPVGGGASDSGAPDGGAPDRGASGSGAPDREAPDGRACGLEVYLLRRVRSMAFAGGMYAFPGGSVDPRDADHDVGWAGPTPAEWAARLGGTDAEARMLVCAAVRETFEESGVLLAGPSADTVVADVAGADWERDRRALVDRELAFSDFLSARSLVLRTDLLGLWAHWITPEFEQRRYDTRFFLAVLPVGQLTRDVSSEADEVCWLTPAAALARLFRGEISMLPPTAVTLRELSEYRSIADVLAAVPSRDIYPITPAVVDREGHVQLVLPGEDGYPS
ncbi:MAG TPA: NUDIX hydrolase [Actinomycetes bacterium]|nr:NUDIX hydrolase [Actinomycetes bacterium]